MTLQLTPDVQARLDQLSGETVRKPEEVVSNALVGYFDELAQVRGLLESRYDHVKNGRVVLLSGEQVAVHFSKKSAARRS